MIKRYQPVMSRLPKPPKLDWTDAGAPLAAAHGDVYFSAQDGLAEARTVFLAGCGLPEAWADKTQFTVAETGFGTGLNFLALWQMWRAHRPSPHASLHFVSFEAFPMRAEDAARALAAWPELADLSAQLIAHWPDSVRGVRYISLSDGVSLILHIDDIAEALPRSRFVADALFLDGFSPAKNDAMWDAALYPQLAARMRHGARAATFTVAGAVRRGLDAAGFSVTKAKGHGHKRERLEAVLETLPPCPADTYGLRGPLRAPERIAIIGAGIAGAGLAHALTRRGADVTVFDAGDAPASGASGNPLALLMPRLDAGDTVQARLLIDAYLLARRTYAALPGTEAVLVRQSPRDNKEALRFAKILDDPPLPLEDLEALRGGGLLHKRELILRPSSLVPALLNGAEMRLATQAVVDAPARRVNGEPFDAIILATGMGVARTVPWLPLEGRLGQIEHLRGQARAKAGAIAGGHYALTSGPDRLWGATFEAHKGGEPHVTDAARKDNLAALEQLSPDWIAAARGGDAISRAGVRATTADRLPVIGAVPDLTAALDRFDATRHGQAVDADAPLLDGLYLATGYGARGFTWGPWAAEVLAAQILGGPSPASAPALQAVSAMRIIFRALKRGEAL